MMPERMCAMPVLPGIFVSGRYQNFVLGGLMKEFRKGWLNERIKSIKLFATSLIATINSVAVKSVASVAEHLVATQNNVA